MPLAQYREFADKVRDLAREAGFTRVEITVEWGNNPVCKVEWEPERVEVFNVTEERKK